MFAKLFFPAESGDDMSTSQIQKGIMSASKSHLVQTMRLRPNHRMGLDNAAPAATCISQIRNIVTIMSIRVWLHRNAGRGTVNEWMTRAASSPVPAP